MSFVKLENLINKSIKKSSLGHKVAAAMVLEDFSKIIEEQMGSVVSKKIKPLYVKDGTLNIACLNSVVVQELKFRESEILKLLNKDLKKEIATRIRYIV